MGERHVEQRSNMIVVEPIVDVSSVAPISDDPGGAEQSERLRDLRLGCPNPLRDLVDAQFGIDCERVQHPESGRVAEEPEERRSVIRQIGVEVVEEHLHICEDIKMCSKRVRFAFGRRDRA